MSAEAEKREFHKRMSAEIAAAIASLRHEFDVSEADMTADRPAWEDLARTLKVLLLAAYARNHSWISE